MKKTFQTVKGFYDILPDKTPLWLFVEQITIKIIEQYAYQHIRLPVLEFSDLFRQGVGIATDIVEKEMYTWQDPLNQDRLTLRPEGTAGCVRALIEHNLSYQHKQLKLWYGGAMFRHENVQKGRQRQFHQMGVEAFGYETVEIEIEQNILLYRLWQELCIAEHLGLEVNTIGNWEERERYRMILVQYLKENIDSLDMDSKRRLDKNPLRILDSKNPQMQDIITKAPRMMDYLDESSRNHFQHFCYGLEKIGIPYQINPYLVRGLDYYNLTVFEWTTQKLGAQGTVAAGGRYDKLVENLGGTPTSACGFAIGFERVLLLAEHHWNHLCYKPDIYLIHLKEFAQNIVHTTAEILRNAGFSVLVHLNDDTIKHQIKKADKSGANFAVILGENEVRENSVTLKYLREAIPQETIALQDAIRNMQARLSK